MTLNPYADDLSERLAAPQGHREVIGGLWDEMGERQASYLAANGLVAGDRLLDIGCGSLRAGVRLVPLLDPGHYYGIDLLPKLLEEGYEREIRPLGLDRRLPRENLFATDDFTIPFEGVLFDKALAQSVFTHLPINHLRLCLHKLRPRMREGGTFFCTFFGAPADLARDRTMRHPPHGQVESFGWRDPFHYWDEDIRFAMDGLGWRFDGLRDWGHPRGQLMGHFVAS